MIDLTLTLDDLFGVVRNPVLVRTDTITPIEITGCPPPEKWRPPMRRDTMSQSDREQPYQSLYMFVHGRYSGLDEIGGDIIKTLNVPLTMPAVSGDLYDLCQDNTPVMSNEEWTITRPFCLALENAFNHGHKNDPRLAVTVKEFKGDKEVIVQICDRGQGFDVHEAVNKYTALKSARKTKMSQICRLDPPEELRYFMYWGIGLEEFVESPLTISFENNGSTVNILYTKEAICKHNKRSYW